MGTILDTQNLSKISELKRSGKTIVLVGGCFDILHPSHIEFLKRAKDVGDILVVLLESDERIRKTKGEERPINPQVKRARTLSSLPHVDHVIMLPNLSKDEDYEILVKKIEPDIIAVTAGNIIFDWEKDYLNKTGGKIIEVIERIPEHSTTKIIKTSRL